MSIPQIPQSVLYTGRNIAVPDWKSFNKDLNARMDMIRREKQQERQFQRQRQDQMNKEFLESVDMDRLNFTHGQFQQASADIYQTFDETVAGIVQDKKGEMSVQDIMKVKALSSSAEQNIAKFKNWEKNWIIDQKAYLDNPDKYSKESRDAIFNYDGKSPYNESKLKLAPWDLYTTKKKLQDVTTKANEASTFSFFNGQGDIRSEGEFTAKFWQSTKEGEQIVPVVDSNGMAIPNYEEQGKFVKGLLASNQFAQGREAMVEEYKKLKPEQQKMWDDLALRYGLDTEGQGDGEILYMMHPDGLDMNPFETGIKRTAYKPTTSGTGDDKRDDIDVTSGYGDMRGASIGVTGRVSGAMTLDGEPMDIVGGKNDSMLTNIRYMNNPKTGKKEWMVEGIYKAKKGDAYYNPMTGTYGKQVVNEPFLVPYDEVKEPIEDKYRVKGMESLKAEESDNTVRYTVKGKVYDIPASEEKAFLESFPKAKKQ